MQSLQRSNNGVCSYGPFGASGAKGTALGGGCGSKCHLEKTCLAAL